MHFVILVMAGIFFLGQDHEALNVREAENLRTSSILGVTWSNSLI